MLTRSIQLFICLMACLLPLRAGAVGLLSVYMEDLTWIEIRDAIGHGVTTAIVPTGGIEQNGPHMVTGKHNVIVKYTSGEIAKRLGNAMAVPVVPYAPAGRIDPPEGHMQFPGTVSLRDNTFSVLLEDIATSLKQNGFRLICFIGDHGGNQSVQQQVADKLSRQWQSSGVRVVHVSSYYKNGQEKWVQSMGIKVPNPEAHAGFIDTSELMAIDTQGIRDNLRGTRGDRDYQATGAMGDSTKSSLENGRRLLSLKIEAAVEQIKHASSSSR